MHLLLTILLETWANLAEMAPYLLLGFLVAGVLSVVVSPEVVERHLGGRGLWPVIKAALFGIPLPLCSCGVIPVGASLRRHGASRGATASFLLSTPQTGVDSILVTYSLLGPVLAVLRPVAALLSGLVGGLAVALFGEGNGGAEQAAPDCHEECCEPEAKGRGVVGRVLHYGFVTLPQDIARALIVGLLLAGVIAALVPDNYFAEHLGGGLAAMLAMMVIGVPLYVCATGSVPIAAALMLKGVSPGAALVFLMTGPATNAATISTVWKVLGRRTALIYLATVCVVALASGLLLDALVGGIAGGAHAGHGRMLPEWFNQLAALLLLGVLGYALARRGGHSHGVMEEAEETMADEQTLALKITGMNCNHCVNSVTRALRESAGVRDVEVDLTAGSALVRGAGLDADALCARVEDLGFEAQPA